MNLARDGQACDKGHTGTRAIFESGAKRFDLTGLYKPASGKVAIPIVATQVAASKLARPTEGLRSIEKKAKLGHLVGGKR